MNYIVYYSKIIINFIGQVISPVADFFKKCWKLLKKFLDPYIKYAYTVIRRVDLFSDCVSLWHTHLSESSNPWSRMIHKEVLYYWIPGIVAWAFRL